jgi:hypothetical protein
MRGFHLADVDLNLAKIPSGIPVPRHSIRTEVDAALIHVNSGRLVLCIRRKTSLPFRRFVTSKVATSEMRNGNPSCPWFVGLWRL